MFHTNNEKHIVRLSALRRGPIATVLEKRSPARIPEKVSGVARGSFRSRATDLRPRLALDRHHHDVSGGMFPEFATRLSTGIYGKIVALLLVPMIFLQPLLPAYAADETVAPPPETTVAPEVAAPVEAPPSVETVSEPVVVEEATPVENATESPEENSVTETASGDASVPIAPTNVEVATEVVPEEHSSPETTVEIAPPSSTEPIAGEGETVVTDTLPSEEIVEDAVSETPTTSSAPVTSEDAAPSQGTPATPATESTSETTPGNDAVSGGASSRGSGGTGSTPPTIEVSPEPGVSPGNTDAAPGDSATAPDPVVPVVLSDGGTPDAVSVPSGDTAGEEPTMSTPDESLTQEAPRENAVPNEDGPLTNEQTPTEVAADAVTPAEKSRDELKREVMEEFLRGCISFERTGYYCIKEEGGSNAGSAPESGSRTVTVEPDGSGYKQIVLTRRGVRTQLTHDAWDNAFPTQDVTGGHIVWQGMKSGRWQIFFGAIAEDGSVAVAQVTDHFLQRELVDEAAIAA